MAAVTLNLYDVFRKKNASGSSGVDLVALTTKCMIVAAGYTPDQNLHDFRDDLGANEVSGTNYTAGGNTCANPIVTMSAAGFVTMDYDDPAVWLQSGAGFTTARRLIFYIARGGAASVDELVAYSNDFGSDKGNVTGDFTVVINASGFFTAAR